MSQKKATIFNKNELNLKTSLHITKICHIKYSFLRVYP